MTELILSDVQAQAVTAAGERMAVRDEHARLLGYLSPVTKGAHFSDEDIEAAKAALREPGPRYTTSQVLEYCRSLEESEEDSVSYG